MIQWLVNDPHVIHFSHLESTCLLVKNVRRTVELTSLVFSGQKFTPSFQFKKKDKTVD